jgi:hypothetical protein
MKLQIVHRDSLYKGMIVWDNDGNKGIVKDCENLHNVHVEFEGFEIDGEIEGEGLGIYCFVEGCEENSELIDPLYYDYRKEKLEKIVK